MKSSVDPYWVLLLFLIIMGVGFAVGAQGTLAAIQAGIDAQETHGVVVGFENRQAVVEYRVADQIFRCTATEKRYKLGEHVSVLYKTNDPATAVVGSFLDRALGYVVFTVAFSGGLGLVLMLTIQKIKAQMAAARKAAGHALVELQQPFEVPTIGTFTLDACRFSTDALWLGQKISLFLSVTRSSELEVALNVARTLWQDQEGWGQRVLDYAVQELLPKKNEDWLEEGEDKFTAEEFAACLALDAVSINPDGSFDFWYQDGQLFSGRYIQISGNLTEGPIDAETSDRGAR